MMRFNLLDILRAEAGPVRASELAERHGVSYPTVWRAVKAADQAVAQWKDGRVSYLAAARDPFQLPVRAVRPDGGVDTLESIILLASGGTRWVDWRGQPRLFEGLPPDVAHARPQGFLGRAFAHRHAAEYRVARNPDDWSDDDVLRMLSKLGDDLPGDLIVGEAAFQRYLLSDPATQAVDFTDLDRAFPEFAARAIAGEAPGSSPGGEQPKFTAVIRDAAGDLRHVIVKFSPTLSGDAPAAATRWADLLACEAIALEVLDEGGFDVARSHLLDAGERRFLISERFDRVGATGRRGLISLGAIDDEYFGQRTTTWVGAAYRLEHAGMVSPESAEQLATLYAFGVLIANSDMHYGNASLQQNRVDGAAFPMSLAPVYDMLPMLYAPQRTEVRPVDFRPAVAITGLGAHALRHAAELAQEYWARCAESPWLSSAFREIATRNRDIVEGTEQSAPRSVDGLRPAHEAPLRSSPRG